MVAGLVLVALLLCAAATGRWGRPATPFLAASSLAWLVVNKGVEGPVLWQVSGTHGLVAADLVGLTGLLLALLALLKPRQS